MTKGRSRGVTAKQTPELVDRKIDIRLASAGGLDGQSPHYVWGFCLCSGFV